MIKITTSYWYTPNGNLIQGKGIIPDYLIEFTDEDIELGEDIQLNKAIEILLEK